MFKSFLFVYYKHKLLYIENVYFDYIGFHYEEKGIFNDSSRLLGSFIYQRDVYKRKFLTCKYLKECVLCLHRYTSEYGHFIDDFLISLIQITSKILYKTSVIMFKELFYILCDLRFERKNLLSLKQTNSYIPKKFIIYLKTIFICTGSIYIKKKEPHLISILNFLKLSISDIFLLTEIPFLEFILKTI